MRIIVVDSDVAFTTKFSQLCKGAGVQCEVFSQAAPGIAELKKSASTVDIVLIAKELGATDGLIVAQTIRRDPKTADVPYVVMSATWGKSDFAKHQKTEFGANAYYNKKSALSELTSTIEAVTNFKFPEAGQAVEETTSAKMPPAPPSVNTNASGVMNVQLQAASDVVGTSEDMPGGISMEQPIDLFANVGEPASAPPTKVAPPQPPKMTAPAPPTAEPETEMQVELGSPHQEMAIPPSSSGGEFSKSIHISTEASAQYQLETTQKQPETTPPSAELKQVSDPTMSVLGMSIEESSIPQTSIEIGLSRPTNAVAAPENIAVEIDVVQKPVAVEPSVTASSVETGPPVSEEEAAKDLPYLFAGASSGSGGSGTRSIIMPHGLNAQSSVVSAPSLSTGSASDDVETLKKYLTMREQDVSVLTAQLTYAKEELGKSEETIKRLGLQGEDLFHQINDLRKKIEGQAQELEHANRNREGELEQLRFEVKSKIDRIKFLEERLSDSAGQYEKLKERVRLDIRKIRVREKELESKLEILKKDSETLIGARENKILELKRKIDLLEFNYDTLQDKNELEKQNVLKGEEKIERINKVLKLALGIIEAESGHQSSEVSHERSKPGEKVA